MSFSIRCPHCKSKLTAKNEKLIGRKMPCPKCKQEFVVEVSKPAAPKPPATSDEVDLGNLDLSNFGPSAVPHDALGLPPGIEPVAGLGDNAFTADPLASGDPLAPLPRANPVQPIAMMHRPGAAATAARPGPAKVDAKDSGKAKRNLLIGVAVATGLLSACVVGGIVTLMMRGSQDQTAVASGNGPPAVPGTPAPATPAPGTPSSPGIPAAGGTADHSGISPTLRNRLYERYVMALRAHNPSMGDDQLRQSAEQGVEQELASQRANYDQFLVVSAEHEALLKSGKAPPNARARSDMLLLALRQFDVKSPVPPGMDDPDALNKIDNGVDAELFAHYLEAGLAAFVTKMDAGKKQSVIDRSQRKVREVIRILREENLAAFKGGLSDVERLAASAGRTEKKPMANSTDPADPGIVSMNNLKQIALGMHNYHDAYKRFPAAVQIGPKDVPHSWRVSILPFVGESSLFERYRQDEPWDSPHNKALLAEMPACYKAPNAAPGSSESAYFGFTPPQSVENQFEPWMPVLCGSRANSISQVPDGTSNTILLVESKSSIAWTQPIDLPISPIELPIPQGAPTPSIGGIHAGGFYGAMADGRTIFFPDSYDRQLIAHLLHPRDGTPVPMPDEIQQKRAASSEYDRLVTSQDPADRIKVSMANLRRIATAVHQYHDSYARLPAAVQIGPNNIPHSWRVSILPFLEEASLYDRYRQDEPWDSPHNRSLLGEMPAAYRVPGSPADSMTAGYFGFTPTVPREITDVRMPALAGTHPFRMADILDGSSNVILCVESKLEVPWTQPVDIPFDFESPIPPIGGVHAGGFCGAMCDASSVFFPDSFDRAMLLRTIQRADGQRIEFPDAPK